MSWRIALLILPDLSIDGAERAIVEYKRHRGRSGRTEDRIAWVVTLTGPTGWARVHIDAGTGKVLAVLRSA